MKAFLLSVVAVVVLAVGARFVLEDFGAQSADQAFATVGARVGDSGSIADRGW